MSNNKLLWLLLCVLCCTTADALEIDLLTPISESPEDLNVQRVINSRILPGYMFARSVKKIKASEELLQETIMNIESNGEFIIYASLRLVASRSGALFSISHSQRKLILLDLSTRGTGAATRVFLRYRSTSDSTKTVVFKDVEELGDRKYHTVLLHISDVIGDNGKKISSVTLYVDCKPFGKAETVSPISSIFSYKGTLLSRLEFRIAQRGFADKIHSQFGGILEKMTLIFKRPMGDLIDGPECGTGLGALRAYQEPQGITDTGTFPHEVAYDLIGLIKDLRYDLSVQVAETKYLRGLVENCQMCRVHDFCRFKPCFPGVPCFNDPATLQGFECGECPLGMVGNGVNCSDVDECKLVDPCYPRVTCQNRSPGYWCPPCPAGYSGKEVHGIGLYSARTNKQVCTDIDECADSPCAKEAKCTNTNGSYECGNCPPGYTGDPTISCYYLNYCDPENPKSNPCSQYAKCIRLDSGRDFMCQCRTNYAGSGLLCAEDSDKDGFPDVELNCSDKGCRKDNCVYVSNPDQLDADDDDIGDVCDDDMDGDGIRNELDNCARIANAAQYNNDGDLFGNDCDNCPYVSNSYQRDSDGDGIGDSCDRDIDGDGVINSFDNCPKIYNPLQEDRDTDTVGDVCDNCPSVRNRRQYDRDDDSLGDACDTDRDDDNDGVDDMVDNCRGVANPDQVDNDQDEKGDACDDDDDDDGVVDLNDNCQLVPNPTQRDLNGNGIGDPCDGDFDNDKVPDAEDPCPVDHHCTRTDFTRMITVELNPYESPSQPPVWVVDSSGTQVTETANSDPGIAVSQVRFGGVDFSGTLDVSTQHDDDFVGIVFSYQSNKQFYLVSWKQKDQVHWNVKPFRAKAVKGIQIKLVNSETGPGSDLRQALWHSGDVKGQTKELWRDSKEEGWEDKTEYSWKLIHRPTIGLIRLKILAKGEVVVDTGYLVDRTLRGGRVGLYVFSQSDVTWKHLSYKANDHTPDDYRAEIPSN